MREYEAGITRTERTGPVTFIFGLYCPEVAAEAVPGQFLQVRTSTGTDPFLRRTFSIADADERSGEVTLLIDEVGRGTSLLCSSKRGGVLSIIGPLGSGFDTAPAKEKTVLMVSGGTGAAPLLFLARFLRRRLNEAAIVFLAGARSASHLEAVRRLSPENLDIAFSTDDGSLGHHGLVTEAMQAEIERTKPAVIYSCGPLPMLREVSRIASFERVACQVSLEERMACGIGACLGCAVKLRDGSMVRSCVEGPVFDASEVVL